MLFDRKLLAPTLVLDEEESFLTFLSTQRTDVVFYVIEDEDSLLFDGDSSKPFMIVIEFEDGDRLIWNPWIPNEN